MDTLPPLPVTVTDPVTAQMCQETGHCCPACPEAARNLHAVAHNAHGAVMNALNGTGNWERAHRKLGTLKQAINAFAEVSGEHFEALEAWRRP